MDAVLFIMYVDDRAVFCDPYRIDWICSPKVMLKGFVLQQNICEDFITKINKVPLLCIAFSHKQLSWLVIQLYTEEQVTNL